MTVIVLDLSHSIANHFFKMQISIVKCNTSEVYFTDRSRISNILAVGRRKSSVLIQTQFRRNYINIWYMIIKMTESIQRQVYMCWIMDIHPADRHPYMLPVIVIFHTCPGDKYIPSVTCCFHLKSLHKLLSVDFYPSTLLIDELLQTLSLRYTVIPIRQYDSF